MISVKQLSRKQKSYWSQPHCYVHLTLQKIFLRTNANEINFGAVLEQVREDGFYYPVAYASCQTNATEAKYAPTELEVATLVYVVTHFEVYLLGNSFTMYTDHQALVSAFIPHTVWRAKWKVC